MTTVTNAVVKNEIWYCAICGNETYTPGELPYCKCTLNPPVFIREEFNKWTGNIEKLYRYTCGGILTPKLEKHND